MIKAGDSYSCSVWDINCPEHVIAYLFSTFLRMIIDLHPTKRPGLGLSAKGHFLASWSKIEDRIVIECLANDDVRWVLSRNVDGLRESGAGKTKIYRIPDVICPYEPDHLFRDGDKLLI